MDRIKQCTNELINAIVESDEYMRFCELKKQVDQDPELHKQINDFRLHVYEVQNTQEPLDMYEEQQKLYRAYEEFRKNPVVNEFLATELGVCRIMQKITKQLTEAIDLDTDDFSGRIGI